MCMYRYITCLPQWHVLTVSMQMKRTTVRCGFLSLKVFIFSHLFSDSKRYENKEWSFNFCVMLDMCDVRWAFSTCWGEDSDFLIIAGKSTTIRMMLPSSQSLKNMKISVLICTDLASVVAQMSLWDLPWKLNWQNY